MINFSIAKFSSDTWCIIKLSRPNDKEPIFAIVYETWHDHGEAIRRLVTLKYLQAFALTDQERVGTGKPCHPDEK